MNGVQEVRMDRSMLKNLDDTLKSLAAEGLYKNERIISSPQSAKIRVDGTAGGEVLNFCSNNYLGLANHPEVVAAAKNAIDRWGFGLSSVRFICGTQVIHKQLEAAISDFLGTEDTILYAACFDANGGVFEPLLGPDDAIISDALNHASIIDGVRLCKARRLRYNHSSMEDLERCLNEASDARFKMICTDGVFSMDGDIADLRGICDLADSYEAMVMIDDCHASGYIGAGGRGTPELCGVEGRVDLITTTFGKALGGASGGCTSGRRELIDTLRQRSRPYLFSNTLAPAIAGATLRSLELIDECPELRDQIRKNTERFKTGVLEAGFKIVPGDTAIVPIMLYDEPLTVRMADRLLEEGIYVTGFSYPVVPKGRARIRVQLSAIHTVEDVDRAIDAFVRVGQELKTID